MLLVSPVRLGSDSSDSSSREEELLEETETLWIFEDFNCCCYSCRGTVVEGDLFEA